MSSRLCPRMAANPTEAHDPMSCVWCLREAVEKYRTRLRITEDALDTYVERYHALHKAVREMFSQSVIEPLVYPPGRSWVSVEMPEDTYTRLRAAAEQEEPK